MAEAFFNNGVTNSGGGLSLGASNTLPAGQIFGRFYYDTSVGDFYFDDGSTWVVIAGGTPPPPPTPTLDQVLGAGNTSTNAVNLTGDFGIFTSESGYRIFSISTKYLNSSSSDASFSTNVFFSTQNNSQFLGNRDIYISNGKFQLRLNNITANLTSGTYRLFGQTLGLTTANNTIYNLVLNNSIDSYSIKSNLIINSAAGNLTLNYWTDFFIGDDYTDSVLNCTVNHRYGMYIGYIKNTNINYGEVYSIYSVSNIVPLYHAGIGFFGTFTNLATTNVSMSLGKPINFENSTSNTSGGIAPEHLIIYINGVQRKIQLRLP